jgi:hypothetical protein
MKLCNLCINCNIEVPFHHYHEDNQPGAEWEVNNSTRDEDPDLRGRATGIGEEDYFSAGTTWNIMATACIYE